MSAAGTARAAGFTLRLPESWVEFDVWRATRTADLARLVDARIAVLPELAARRRALLRALREVAARAERQGAVFCAAMADSVPDAGLLTATLIVFQTEPASEPERDSVAAIAGQVSAVAPTEGSLYWRRVEVVDLRVGRAVRVAGVEVADVGGRAPVPGVVMQTLVPVPGGQGVLNAVLTSPMVDLAEAMLDLFDAITETLAWAPSPDTMTQAQPTPEAKE